MNSEALFPPRIVCAALGIPHGTLTTWANRGYFASFDAGLTIKGKARQFSLKDALALALMKEGLSEVTGNTETVSIWAPFAAKDWLKNRKAVRELHIYEYEDETVIRYNDDLMNEPLRSDSWVRRCSFNLTSIFESASIRLEAFMDDGETGELIEE